MDLDAFVSEHGAEWNRLQRLIAKPVRRLSPAEVDEMLALYRRAGAHLSIIRSRSDDPTLVAWLSRLVLEARARLTPPVGFSSAAVSAFFAVRFPAAVYRSGRWSLGVATAFLILTGVLIALVASDPSIGPKFMSPQAIDELVQHGFADYYSQSPPPSFAALVWTNNSFVTAICLAGGVLFLPTLYMLWMNVFNVGLVGGLMVGHGRADVFFGLICVHGLLELTCVFIAAGVGLRIGWAWVAPGRARSRREALAEAGRSGMVVALGLVAPLAISGMVEAAVTPSPLPIAAKLVVGALVWLAFLGYIVVRGRAAVGAGLGADVDPYERPVEAPAV